MGSSSVNILSLSSITGTLVVSPALSSVTTSQTLQMKISTPGVSNTDISWAVTGGTITPDGAFTPPNTSGPYIVRASLPNAAGSATVEVTDFPGTFTWRNDNSRSGVNNQELALTPATVSPQRFGLLFSCPIDGYADAQPLYAPNLAISGMGTHNVVLIATENDSVFAFDADANPCMPLWKTRLIPQSDANTSYMPVGIIGTPVVGGNTPTMYVVAEIQTTQLPTKTNPNYNPPTYSHQLYALDLTILPTEIQPFGETIAWPGSPTTRFYSLGQEQRPALLLDSGTVYIAFGTNGLPDTYHGWLFGYDSSTLQPTDAFNATPDTVQGGIWQSGGGPSSDSSHNIFVLTGDGPPNIGTNYSDSFLRLETNGGLNVVDYFTPCDQELGGPSSADPATRSGSSAPVLLPDFAGSHHSRTC